MFVRSFAAIVLVLPALGGAVSVLNNNNNNAITSTNGVPPTTGTQPTTTNQCNTGTLQCCEQLQSSDFSEVITLLGSIAGVIGGPDTLVGFSCSPTSIAAIAGGSSCSTQPVCCTNNDFNGRVALGCTPVNSFFARDMESDLELAFAELVGTLANTVVESAGGGVPDLPTDLPIDSLIALATGDGIGELPVESMTDGSTVLDPFEDLI